jgi:fatty acid desaturase
MTSNSVVVSNVLPALATVFYLGLMIGAEHAWYKWRNKEKKKVSSSSYESTLAWVASVLAIIGIYSFAVSAIFRGRIWIPIMTFTVVCGLVAFMLRKKEISMK